MRNLAGVAILVFAVAAAVPALGQPAAALPGTPPAGSNLMVATVKLDSGWRASKMIGSAVYNEQSERVGVVEDLVITGADKITTTVISVGGFLGIGSKLIAVPFSQLRVAPDLKVTLPGASKDALNGMPSFTWGS